MTLNVLKSKKDWLKHLNIIKNKFNYAPYKIKSGEPKKYPCFVVSSINLGVNGYVAENLFIYKNDLRQLK